MFATDKIHPTIITDCKSTSFAKSCSDLHINTDIVQHSEQTSSPISSISIERQKLLQAQHQIQENIRKSINDITAKIIKIREQNARDITTLTQKRIRLIKEFNNGVLNPNDRIRGTTPPEYINKIKRKHTNVRDMSINTHTNMTISHEKAINNLQEQLKQHKDNKESTLCILL